MRDTLLTSGFLLVVFFIIGSVDWIATQIGWIVGPVAIFSLLGFLIWVMWKIGHRA